MHVAVADEAAEPVQLGHPGGGVRGDQALGCELFACERPVVAAGAGERRVQRQEGDESPATDMVGRAVESADFQAKVPFGIHHLGLGGG